MGRTGERALHPLDRSGQPPEVPGRHDARGERDELIPHKEIRKFYAQLAEPKELVIIDAADHLFDGKVSEVGDAIEDLLADYETPTN